MSRLVSHPRYPLRPRVSARARQRGAALIPPPPFLRHSTSATSLTGHPLPGSVPGITPLAAADDSMARQAVSQTDLLRVWRMARHLVAGMLGLVILVIGLGAWTRLVDAGLGCPDWPGCYGALVVPDAHTASLHSPHHPLEGYKAWAEMIHRYAASLLGLASLALLVLGWRVRRRERRLRLARSAASMRHRALDMATCFPLAGCWLLLAALLIQGAFGAFTVTLKLWPQVVTLHLLGGLGVASLLLLLWLSLTRRLAARGARATLPKAADDHGHRVLRQPWLATLAAALLLGQLALGGWTSSNYAGLACEGFPTCNGSLWPAMDWGEGFHLSQDVGPSYLHGQLHGEARTAIHLAHRGGAVLLGAVLLMLYWRQRRHVQSGHPEAVLPSRPSSSLARPLARLAGDRRFMTTGTLNPWGWALAAWGLQAGLGIANVLWWLPLDLALAHTLGAVMLTLAMVWAMDRMSQAHRVKRTGMCQTLA